MIHASNSAVEVHADLVRAFGVEAVATWAPEKRRAMGRVADSMLTHERTGRMKTWRDRLAAACADKDETGAPIPALSENDIRAIGGKGRIPTRFPVSEKDATEDAEIRALDTDHRIAETEAEYLALAIEETGQSTSDEKQAEIIRRFRQLKSQSHRLARRLKSAGVESYRDTPFAVYHFAIHSGTIVKVPGFRRICLLPYVAWMMRGPVVSALEYFLERNPFCRFWTFSAGPRVPLPQLRSRVKYLHRRISQLNAEPWMKELGLEIVFRSTEFGTIEKETAEDGGAIERDRNGRPMFHPHAHCIVLPTKGFIDPEKWAAMLRRVNEFWVYHWDEGGAIKSAAECCKYVTKPGDMLKLTPGELAQLHAAIFRLKLAQPSGALAAELADREERGERLVKKQTRDGRVSREVLNWNKGRRKSKLDKDAEALAKVGRKSTGADFCAVISRSVPSFCGAGLKEPRVTIMTNGPLDLERVRQIPLVRDLIAATADQWQAGRMAALLIRVHTCTPTVGQSEDRPPDPILPRYFREKKAAIDRAKQILHRATGRKLPALALR